ncbi:MAG: Holliday junction branch migration protein RuvA [Anaerolineaceae bacterium]|nr:Holliday junction branch migration protein RuvA [Anaerolineaceae bacterium]MBN2677217.1 Holliday junction branch migration protein RuvA [Anaerolineaceae bacterium]
MIDNITGKLSRVDKDGIVVMIGNVGLRISVPEPLRIRVSPDDHLELFTNLVVREDSLTLYGFPTLEECQFFKLLLSVSGVGPRTALTLLSVLSTDSLRRAILSEQADVIGRVPGVGRMTSQKIVIALQNKVGPAGSDELMAPASETDAEVLSALTSLGYSVIEAQTALQSIPQDTPTDVETRLRLALQYFA